MRPRPAQAGGHPHAELANQVARPRTRASSESMGRRGSGWQCCASHPLRASRGERQLQCHRATASDISAATIEMCVATTGLTRFRPITRRAVAKETKKEETTSESDKTNPQSTRGARNAVPVNELQLEMSSQGRSGRKLGHAQAGQKSSDIGRSKPSLTQNSKDG